MKRSVLNYISVTNESVFSFANVALLVFFLGCLLKPGLVSAQKCDYYSKVQTAEDELIRYNYFEASTIYKQTFEAYNDIYLKDLNNALISAYYSEDHELLYFFTDLLNQYSIDSSYLNEMLSSVQQPSINIISDTIEIGDGGYGKTPLCILTTKLNILDQSLRRSCKELSPSNPYINCGREIRLLDSLILY